MSSVTAPRYGRLKSYDRLGDVLGHDEAGTLMELLPPNGWDDIATKESTMIALAGFMLPIWLTLVFAV